LGDDTVTTFKRRIIKFPNDFKVAVLSTTGLKILGFRKGRAGSIPASSTKHHQNHDIKIAINPSASKGLRVYSFVLNSLLFSSKRTKTALPKCSAKEGFGVVGDDTMTPPRFLNHRTFSNQSHIFNHTMEAS